MHVVDAGDVALDQIVDELLSEAGIRSLAGTEPVICFALARAGLSQEFFEKLILNVDTIDFTTRQHIAFVVFYGNELSIVSCPHMGSAPLRFRVNGMSRSPPHYQRYFDRKVYDAQFDERIAEKLRADPHKAPLKHIARVMEGVTDRMLQRLEIRERNLPCLLFIDKEEPRRQRVVPLNPKRPMESLYNDVLAPLSDELRDLEHVWRNLSQWQTLDRDVARARKIATDLPSTVDRLSAELADIKRRIDAEVNYRKDSSGAWVAEFEALSQVRSSFSQVSSLEEKLSLIPLDHSLHSVLPKARAAFAELEAERRAFSNRPSLTDAEKIRRSKLGKLTNQARSALSEIGEQFRKDVNARFDKLRRALENLETPPKDLVAERSSISGELDRAKRDLNSAEVILAINRGELERYVNDARIRFQREGYKEAFVSTSALPTFEVVENMSQRGLIGFVKTMKIKAQKILFLASNPLDSSSLDLEEELRTVDLELAATDGRKKVILAAKHAIRADDLVRHIRTEQPSIVHFSGHGTANGIAVRGDDGNHRIVSGDALARLFAGRGVKLVVLNACFSMSQAMALVRSVRTVVGTTAAVDDEAARRFSASFYRTLGNGYTVADAFRDGGDAVTLHSLNDVFHLIGDCNFCLAT